MTHAIKSPKALIQCPLCSRTLIGLARCTCVSARILCKTMPGQKCRQCGAGLDASRVLETLPLAGISPAIRRLPTTVMALSLKRELIRKIA